MAVTSNLRINGLTQHLWRVPLADSNSGGPLLYRPRMPQAPDRIFDRLELHFSITMTRCSFALPERSKPKRLEPSELLFETVAVVSGEIVGLLDDAVA